MDLASALKDAFLPEGFRPVDVAGARFEGCALILKRQTLMTNRAIAYVRTEPLPDDFGSYLKAWRSKVTWKAGFFPFFYGLGLQMIVACDRVPAPGIDLDRYVAKVDNQWSIIQSVYLVEESVSRFWHARTWGQFLTGRYQDRIVQVLSTVYQPS